jgi:hypothetical protein
LRERGRSQCYAPPPLPHTGAKGNAIEHGSAERKESKIERGIERGIEKEEGGGVRREG